MKLKTIILGLLAIQGVCSTMFAQLTRNPQTNLGASGLPVALVTSQSLPRRSLSISAALPPATTGASYSGTFTASGGTAPYHYTVSSGQLPSGLLLSATSGTLSGTPSKAGTFSFAISAQDLNLRSGTHSFQMTVAPAPSVAVSVTPATTTVQSAGSAQFSALVSNTSNATVTWSASLGTISSAGLYQAATVSTNTTVTITATSAADPTKSGTASVTITPPPLFLTTTSVSAASAGVAYSNSFTVSGGTAPYNWTLTSGALPAGFALQSSGSLSGTTTQSGQFSFTVQVSDASSPKQTASQSFSLTVSGPLPPAAFFGFTENTTSTTNFPTVSYGMQRFWDSPPLQWPSINTASGVFDFSNLDTALAHAFSNGVTEGMYTLARTPPWATSNPADTTCNYTNAALGGGAGECDAPIDLNSDGSGSNAIWKAWITAIASHANNPTYLQTHAHIKYWEVWNEPDTKAFFAGSIAQLARLTEDAKCIITGRGVIHENGNGTATPCTATAIDPSAQIVMASGHAKTVALTYAQNQLYCNANPSGIELPCPNPPNAIAAAVDIINFHMKPGNETGDNCPVPTPCTPESAMQFYVNNIHSILQPAELAKPLWDGEASYSISGFSGAYTDPDMAASFMARFYVTDWSLGISGTAWYTWDQLKAQPAQVQTAYQQTYNWLSTSGLTTPCTATGTVWSCGIVKSGTPYLIMWDTAQSCANGSCTTANQIVASEFTEYQDMTSASAPIMISGHAVPVGIKPVVLH